MEAEPATAYAVLLHAIQMVCLILLGVWGLSRLDIRMGEILAEVRDRVGGRSQSIEEHPDR